ncbi:MAG: hypothetical protein M0Q13_02700 [Methanothrix sp.]|jgi:hypothetical protein|nr:hypothetical protein [Methanothrix sp.]
MEEQKSKFCVKDSVCNISGLSRRILKSNGCTKYESCNEFCEKNNKIKENILNIKAACKTKKCYKGSNIKKVKSSCIECRNFKISEDFNLNNLLEILSRCIDEYCFKGKSNIDFSCIDCDKLRLFNDNSSRWVEFRGGKDLKGNNF